MRVYGRLAEELVDRSPVSLRGCRVLDLGAGTGAASRALPESDVVAVDGAIGMLLDDRGARPPAVAADLLALPFGGAAFDAVVAAFSLNHLDEPWRGLREAGRVAPLVLASTYAVDDDHPVKGAVDAALRQHGWTPPEWYSTVKGSNEAWGTVNGATDVVTRGGLEPVTIEHARVAFGELSPIDLVRWRLGMASCASYAGNRDVEQRALELLGDDVPTLVRSVLFIVARAR